MVCPLTKSPSGGFRAYSGCPSSSIITIIVEHITSESTEMQVTNKNGTWTPLSYAIAEYISHSTSPDPRSTRSAQPANLVDDEKETP